MNKKVEELVERVRLTDEEIEDICERYAMRNWPSILIEAQLNKVLSDPDLALIDRGSECHVIIGTQKERNFWYDGYKACKKSIIPLKEALELGHETKSS